MSEHFPATESFVKEFRTLKIGLDRDRKELYRRIEDRVDRMFEAGLSGRGRAAHRARRPGGRASVQGPRIQMGSEKPQGRNRPRGSQGPDQARHAPLRQAADDLVPEDGGHRLVLSGR